MTRYSSIPLTIPQRIIDAWRREDYETMLSFGTEDISSYEEDRAACALYIAYAAYQTNQRDKGDHWINQGLSWGANNFLCMQVLLAGTQRFLRVARYLYSNQEFQYNFDKSSSVWNSLFNYEYSYTDGSHIEINLLKELQLTEDLSLYSTELRRLQKDWISTYHLSSDRANLLRPFENRLIGKDVLELGCGCGAITRYLGEIGANVWAIEGSYSRASITRERCRDQTNVSVFCDKIEKVALTHKFDVVTLIGVLEYSRVYIDENDPIQLTLQKASHYLKPDGLLIVAIENQLGLKYFAGAREDHGLGVMAGINDLYTAKSPVTFGKKDLESRILNAGFNFIENHLPFPDYKLPCLILHPEGYQDPSRWNAGEVIASNVHIDRQTISEPFFSLEAAWPVVFKNGLIGDLANSYLIIAHKGVNSSRFSEEKLASYYSPGRSLSESQKIDFIYKNEKVKILRTRGSNIISPKEERYVAGKLHSQFLHSLIQRPGWKIEDVIEWARIWECALRSNLIKFPKNIPSDWKYDYWLPADYIDAIPKNLILQEMGHCFIDLEWSASHDLPLALVIYRGLIVTFNCLTSIAEPEDIIFTSSKETISAVMEALGHKMSDIDLPRFIKVIHELTSKAKGITHQDSSSNHLPLPLSQPLKNFKIRRSFIKTTDQESEITLYWRKEKDEYLEKNTSKSSLIMDGREQFIYLSLAASPSATYSGLRLDIASKPGFFIVRDLSLYTHDKQLLWKWNMSIDELDSITGLTFFKAQNESEVCFRSKNKDPQFQIKLPAELLDKISKKTTYLRLKILAYG